MTWDFYVELPAVDRLSPSRFGLLRTCKLAFGLSEMRPSWHNPITSTFMVLGTVSHKVLELAERLEHVPALSEQQRAFVSDLWDKAIFQAEARMMGRPVDQHLLVAARWPRYSLTRARTLREALAILERKASHSGASGATKRHSAVEEPVVSSRLGLKGTPDRVEFTSEGLVIVDWKSSLGNEDDPSMPKAEHQEQLLLYAALVREQYEQLPSVGRIQVPSGESVEMPILAERVDELVESARRLLAQYNVARERDPWDSLAVPEEGVCGRCEYRYMCPAYWDSDVNLDPTWDSEGTLREINQFAAGFRIVVETEAGESVELSRLDTTQFAYLETVEVGTPVRLVDFYRLGEDEPVLATSRSRIYAK